VPDQKEANDHIAIFGMWQYFGRKNVSPLQIRCNGVTSSARRGDHPKRRRRNTEKNAGDAGSELPLSSCASYYFKPDPLARTLLFAAKIR
jgi:hypothetical protein